MVYTLVSSATADCRHALNRCGLNLFIDVTGELSHHLTLSVDGCYHRDRTERQLFLVVVHWCTSLSEPNFGRNLVRAEHRLINVIYRLTKVICFDD